MNYSKGSIWRKWDLHIHTPVSLVQNYGGLDLNTRWENFITDIESLPEEFKVIGINDYLFIDGYERILDYKSQGRLRNIDTIFPVIEFRIKKFGGHKEFKRVNFHVLFSDKLKPTIIRQQFLNQLYGKYKLAVGNEEIEWSGAITEESLQDLGRKIKESVPSEKQAEFGTDIEEGFNNINFDEEEIIKLLKGSSYLRTKYITAIGKTEWDAFKWNDNSIAEKKSVINSVDFVFTSSETIAAFNNAKEKLKEQKVNDLLLDCSDAHNYSNAIVKDRIGKCFSWIKADTTFEGLKQVINEPDRLFVGGMPELLERVKIAPNKFISKLKIDRINDCKMSEMWYEKFEIELNPSLVAVIGNKGNGKSALTDIIGLVGNSYNENFSFLTKQKFRSPRPYNRASNIEAKIEWLDQSYDGYTNLNSNCDLSKQEKVKYIPQNFLETLCANEDEQDFEKEIKKIIFSHTSDTDKMGFSNLDELINFKSEIINKEVGTIKGEIDDVNQKIILLERKNSLSFRQSLDDGLKNKEEELKNCDLLKPVFVETPVDNPELEERNKIINQKISSIRQNIADKNSQLVQNTLLKGRLQQELVELDKIKQALQNVESTINNFSNTQSSLIEKFGVNSSDLITYNIHFDVLEKIILSKTSELSRINAEIFGTGNDSKGIEAEISESKLELLSLEEKLDEPYRLYQKYLQDLENWDNRRKSIIGEKTIQGTVAYFKDQIAYLNEHLQEDISTEVLKRDAIILKLFKKKSELIETYKSSYKPISDFIMKYGYLMKDYQINLTVEFALEGFTEKFFDHISQGAKGTYIGVEEGNRYLVDLIPQYNVNESEGLITFLAAVRDSLFFDKKSDQNNIPREVEKQLKKGYTVEDLYRFLYYLDFLKPVFKLNLGDKSLSSLSPGERGALLLIFYLFLDKDDKPLIIDQPEENLDNQSVYTYLVHFIKEAKKKRQIIMVTHNPNLAVVCDAEQVIHMSIDKVNNHTVSCEAGAIENPIINKVIVDILEGTKPAFKNRTNKYLSIFA